MNFVDDESDHALAELAELVIDRTGGPAALRAAESAGGFHTDLWRAMTEAGLAGLLVPDEFGGGGAGPGQARIVATALGSSTGLTPFAWSSALATTLLAGAPADPARTQLLTALAAGEVVAVALAAPRGDIAPITPGVASALVPAGPQARWLLLPDPAGDDVTLSIVDLSPARLPAEQRSDLQAVSRVDPAALWSAVADVLPVSRETWERAAAVTRLALAAYALGGSRRLVRLASSYASDRRQFGRPIGAFQAVAHRCSAMHARATADAVLVELAAWSLDVDDLATAADRTRQAKARATQGYAAAAADALQIFGGHGFAAESDVQLLFRQAQGLHTSWGSPDAEYAAVGAGYGAAMTEAAR